MFIEVKATTLGPRTDFLISVNELAFSEKYAEQYRLYRLFHLKEEPKGAEFFVIEGNLRDKFRVIATEYRVTGL